jgi:hypothetical protein
MTRLWKSTFLHKIHHHGLSSISSPANRARKVFHLSLSLFLWGSSRLDKSDLKYSTHIQQLFSFFHLGCMRRVEKWREGWRRRVRMEIKGCSLALDFLPIMQPIQICSPFCPHLFSPFPQNVKTHMREGLEHDVITPTLKC